MRGERKVRRGAWGGCEDDGRLSGERRRARDRAAGRQTRAAMRGRGERTADGSRGRNRATAGNLRKLAARRAEASG